MSDSLFGGATNTVADISDKLAEIQKTLSQLSSTVAVAPKRNANVMADAVKMEGECPTGLVGCNASELYNKTGGQVTCPPLEQAPDPIITDYKGRICYAPESIRKQFEGKDLNVKKLMETYAMKLVKLLEKGNNLAVAVEAARAGPKGSPIVLNFYANNTFVTRFATGGSKYFSEVREVREGLTTFGTQGRFRGITDVGMGGEQLVSADEMAAVLTKFSNNLNPNAGASLLNFVLTPLTTNQRGTSAQLGPLDNTVPSIAVHGTIAEYIFTAVYATQRDSSRRAKYVELLDGLAEVLKFGEFASTYESRNDALQQSETATNAAIAFLPKALKDWLANNNKDPALVLLNFFCLSMVCVTIEAYNNKVPSGQYMNSIKALRLAFDNMRKTEYDATQLLEQKAKGIVVADSRVDQALQDKKGAAQTYVVQTVKVGKVLANLLGITISGDSATVDDNPVKMGDASIMMKTIAANVNDAKLMAAIRSLRNLTVRRNFIRESRFQTGFGYIITGRASLYVDVNAVPLCLNFFNRVVGLSKMMAFSNVDVEPVEEVIITKGMFATQMSAKQSKELVNIQEKAKFQESLPNDNNQFCKVPIGSGFAYISVDPVSPNFNAQPLLTYIGNLKGALREGNLARISSLLRGITQDEAAFLVSRNCTPISTQEYASVRKQKILGDSAIDQVFLRAYDMNNQQDSQTVQRMRTTGLELKERDHYSVMLVFLSAIADDPKLAAALILASSNADAIATLAVSFRILSNKFRSHGKLAGGDELEGGDIEEDFDFSGGDDWENAADLLLNGGSTLPAHQMPEEIVQAVHKTAKGQVNASGQKYRTSEDVKELKKRFKDLGYNITTMYAGKTCPAYINASNNTFGTPGQKQWVATKHAWAKCQEQMGFQFVSDEGFCYPYGMTCYPDDDVKTTTKKTIETVDNWIQMAKIFNSVQQKEYEQWLEGEKARIRSEPQNANLTDKEVEDIAKTHMPPEYMGIPDYGAVQTMVTLSTQIEDAVNEISTTSDISQRERIKNILRSSGSMREEWSDEDKTVENMNLDRIAGNLLVDAKACTDASLVVVNNVAKSDVNKALTAVVTTGDIADAIGAVPLAIEQNQNVIDEAGNKCSVLKTGETPGDAVLIPNSINSRIDLAKVANGEPVDPIVTWWRTYYGQKAKQDKAKYAKIHQSLSPSESASYAKQEKPTAQDALEKALRQALDSEGRKILRQKTNIDV